MPAMKKTMLFAMVLCAIAGPLWVSTGGMTDSHIVTKDMAIPGYTENNSKKYQNFVNFQYFFTFFILFGASK